MIVGGIGADRIGEIYPQKMTENPLEVLPGILDGGETGKSMFYWDLLLFFGMEAVKTRPVQAAEEARKIFESMRDITWVTYLKLLDG